MRLDCVYGCFFCGANYVFWIKWQNEGGRFFAETKEKLPVLFKTPPYRDKKRGIIFPKAACGALQTVKMSLPVAPKRYGPGKKSTRIRTKITAKSPFLLSL